MAFFTFRFLMYNTTIRLLLQSRSYTSVLKNAHLKNSNRPTLIVQFIVRNFRLNRIFLSCWNCGTENKNKLFCNSCRVLQMPNTANTYFEIIEIPRRFEVNILELTKKYRELQRMLHPDRFSNHSDKERQISEEYSSLVNKAYSTLLDPMSRGLYMLQLEGGSIEESKMQTNSELLMEIMERNEELADINSAEELKRFDEKNQASIQELTKALSEAFDKNSIPDAEIILAKMKYYRSLDSKIRELKQKLGVVKE